MRRAHVLSIAISYDNITWSPEFFEAVTFKPNLRVMSVSTQSILPDSRQTRDIGILMMQKVNDYE